MTTETLSILGVPGSLRRASYNHGLLWAAREATPPGVELEIFDIGPIPLYNGDLEAEGFPAPVRELRDRVRAADGLLIATPEYNWSAPGVLKNVVDWVSRPPDQPLRRKPIARMGASSGMFGTARAQLTLRQVLTPLESYVLPQPQLTVAGAGAKFDADGNLTDEETRERVRALVEALVAWTCLLRAGRQAAEGTVSRPTP